MLRIVLKKIILLLLFIVLVSCKTTTEPVKNNTKWENITYNLSGEKIINVKVHTNKLYASTYNNIYWLDKNNWEIIASSDSEWISDFEFRNDSLFF